MTNRIKLLSLRDFDVTVASTGQEALALAKGREFDLVLLDLKMPSISGEEVLQVLKEEYPLTKVVILTGHNSIESAVEYSRTDSYMYLQKPAETADLLRVLNS
jgi:DNA-binding NtrC family response regulator